MHKRTLSISDALIGTPKCPVSDGLCILEALALKNVLLDCKINFFLQFSSIENI